MEIYHQEINPLKVITFWSEVIKSGEGGILVNHDGEQIKGILGFTSGEDPFQGTHEVLIQFIYILPEYRGGQVFNQLISEVEGWGYPIELSLSTSKVNKAMSRRGYEPKNIIYRKG